MLAAYRARNRELWSAEQKESNKLLFSRMGGGRSGNDDGLDVMATTNEFTINQRTDSQKQVKHSRELLDHFEMLIANGNGAANIRPMDEGGASSSAGGEGSESHAIGNVATLPFDEHLSASKREDPATGTGDEDKDDDGKAGDDAMHQKRRKLSAATEKKIDRYIERQRLSPDKDVAVNIMREHCKAMHEGWAEDDDYEPPFLLVCGKPGNGKSKLVETFDGMAERMSSGVMIKNAYMGSAAVNINGATLLKFWDIPVYEDKEAKKFGRWDPNKLQKLKKMLGGDIYRICCIVLDEVSTIQPYMLACLNARLQEMFQNNKLWGGRAVVLLGDFDQKPPTAGGKANTLPGSVMEPLERGTGVAATTESARRLDPTRMGGWLLSKARYIKLTSQHRASGDATHTDTLNEMSEAGHITVDHLKKYKQLSSEDLAGDDFRFATMIVTGNNERREINARQAGRWAEHFGVSNVRWARKRNEQSWKGRPQVEDNVTHAMGCSLFWELFVPGAKGYLNTYGINSDIGLANGTEIKYHSLSFGHKKDERNLTRKLGTARPGDTVTIEEPPTAINVELFADFADDPDSAKKGKADARAAWLESDKGSITADGKVVIPISLQDGSRIPYKTEHIPGCNETGRFYRASQIPMKDYFPIEPAFAVTVDKAQVRCFSTVRFVLLIAARPSDPTFAFSCCSRIRERQCTG
jgi:energy-coupling factor transporter ATP-binding protein EcfA2